MEYLLFVGENASYGNPNSITGRYSFYGRILKFRSKEERNLYIEEKTGYTSREIVKKGNRKTLRKYDLGSTLQNYNDYLDYTENTIKNEFEEWV
jgi:hypothetical protein